MLVILSRLLRLFLRLDSCKTSCNIPSAMFGKRFLGLRGHNLNLAISIIAGVDFFLFGYDQGVMGGLLTLKSFTKTFPEIDVGNARQEDRNHVSTIQGIAVASYNVGMSIFHSKSGVRNLINDCRLFLRRHLVYLDWRLAR